MPFEEAKNEIDVRREWVSIESDWFNQAKDPQAGATPDQVSSATKVYLLLYEGQQFYFHLGSQVTYAPDGRWEAPITLVNFGTPLGFWGDDVEVETFVETYINHEDSELTEIVPHLVFSASTGKLFWELDPSLRFRTGGESRDPAFGVLGFAAYRMSDNLGVGLRTVADYSPDDELVWLGPSLEFDTPVGIGGFFFAGFDTHGPVASTNLMLRLSGSL